MPGELAGRRRGLHRVEQMIGEHEVAEVIHYKLFFEQGDVLIKNHHR
jgi:hypothetical protein